MPVAKSYLGKPLIGDPFEEKGKMYIYIQVGEGKKKVRWYTNAEFQRMYAKEAEVLKEISLDKDPYFRTQKEVLGFKEGYIWILKGDSFEDKDSLKELGATYTKFWGWSFSSEKELPEELPEGVEAVKLLWESVGKEDGTLKTESEIAAAVDSMRFEAGCSEYQGEIGQRLDLRVKVSKNMELTSIYGVSHMHEFEDEEGNVYVWFTSAKSWPVGSEKHIKGTVKEFKTFRNVKQTILTRCSEVK